MFNLLSNEYLPEPAHSAADAARSAQDAAAEHAGIVADAEQAASPAAIEADYDAAIAAAVEAGEPLPHQADLAEARRSALAAAKYEHQKLARAAGQAEAAVLEALRRNRTELARIIAAAMLKHLDAHDAAVAAAQAELDDAKRAATEATRLWAFMAQDVDGGRGGTIPVPSVQLDTRMPARAAARVRGVAENLAAT